MKGIKRNTPLLSLSKNAGFVALIIILGFTIWSSAGEPWHRYVLNFVIIGVATMLVGNNFIQGVTRGFSYIYIYKHRGVLKFTAMILPAFLFFLVACFLVGFSFSISLQYYSYFATLIFLSTIVAISDGQFKAAIEKTKLFEANENEI